MKDNSRGYTTNKTEVRNDANLASEGPFSTDLLGDSATALLNCPHLSSVMLVGEWLITVSVAQGPNTDVISARTTESCTAGNGNTDTTSVNGTVSRVGFIRSLANGSSISSVCIGNEILVTQVQTQY